MTFTDFQADFRADTLQVEVAEADRETFLQLLAESKHLEQQGVTTGNTVLEASYARLATASVHKAFELVEGAELDNTDTGNDTDNDDTVPDKTYEGFNAEVSNLNEDILSVFNASLKWQDAKAIAHGRAFSIKQVKESEHYTVTVDEQETGTLFLTIAGAKAGCGRYLQSLEEAGTLKQSSGDSLSHAGVPYTEEQYLEEASKHDKLIDKAFKKHGYGHTINMRNLSKVFREAGDALKAGKDLDKEMPQIVKKYTVGEGVDEGKTPPPPAGYKLYTGKLERNQKYYMLNTEAPAPKWLPMSAAGKQRIKPNTLIAIAETADDTDLDEGVTPIIGKGVSKDKLANAPKWLLRATTRGEKVAWAKDGKTLVWLKGSWLWGDWKDGIWEGGHWGGGTWHHGIWKSGTWHGGEWNGGTWIGGVWKYGVWGGGTWHHGIWEKGTWKGGVWKDGVWKDGTRPTPLREDTDLDEGFTPLDTKSYPKGSVIKWTSPDGTKSKGKATSGKLINGTVLVTPDGKRASDAVIVKVSTIREDTDLDNDLDSTLELSEASEVSVRNLPKPMVSAVNKIGKITTAWSGIHGIILSVALKSERVDMKDLKTLDPRWVEFKGKKALFGLAGHVDEGVDEGKRAPFKYRTDDGKEHVGRAYAGRLPKKAMIYVDSEGLKSALSLPDFKAYDGSFDKSKYRSATLVEDTDLDLEEASYKVGTELPYTAKALRKIYADGYGASVIGSGGGASDTLEYGRDMADATFVRKILDRDKLDTVLKQSASVLKHANTDKKLKGRKLLIVIKAVPVSLKETADYGDTDLDLDEAAPKLTTLSFGDEVEINTQYKRAGKKPVMNGALYDWIAKKFGKGNGLTITNKASALKKGKVEIHKSVGASSTVKTITLYPYGKFLSYYDNQGGGMMNNGIKKWYALPANMIAESVDSTDLASIEEATAQALSIIDADYDAPTEYIDPDLDEKTKDRFRMERRTQATLDKLSRKMGGQSGGEGTTPPYASGLEGRRKGYGMVAAYVFDDEDSANKFAKSAKDKVSKTEVGKPRAFSKKWWVDVSMPSPLKESEIEELATEFDLDITDLDAVDHDTTTAWADSDLDEGMSKSQAQQLLKVYSKNEDRNYHTENIVLLAKAFYGTSSREYKYAKAMLDYREDNKEGAQPDKAMDRKINMSYYKLKTLAEDAQAELDEALETANIIRKQLGQKALFMMGAKNLAGDKHSLSFRIGKNSSGGNHVKIHHGSDDLYTVTVSAIRGGKVKVKKEFKSVYADKLHKTLQDATGMALSLTKHYESDNSLGEGLSTADKHQKKIAIDTVRNPAKALLGGPSAKEAETVLRTKFKYSDKQIQKIKEHTMPLDTDNPLDEAGYMTPAIDAIYKSVKDLKGKQKSDALAVLATAVLVDYLNKKGDKAQAEQSKKDSVRAVAKYTQTYLKEGATDNTDTGADTTDTDNTDVDEVNPAKGGQLAVEALARIDDYARIGDDQHFEDAQTAITRLARIGEHATGVPQELCNTEEGVPVHTAKVIDALRTRLQGVGEEVTVRQIRALLSEQLDMSKVPLELLREVDSALESGSSLEFEAALDALADHEGVAPDVIEGVRRMSRSTVMQRKRSARLNANNPEVKAKNRARRKERKRNTGMRQAEKRYKKKYRPRHEAIRDDTDFDFESCVSFLTTPEDADYVAEMADALGLVETYTITENGIHVQVEILEDTLRVIDAYMDAPTDEEAESIVATVLNA